MRRLPVLGALVVSLAVSSAWAQVPVPMQKVGVDERLGNQVPGDLLFTDSTRAPFRIGDFFDGRRPVLLVLAYYHCPMLCSLLANGLASALRQLPWKVGDQYRALTVSIDPTDTPGEAQIKQAATLQPLNQPEATRDWPFLVGSHEAIQRLADSVGFRYGFDPVSGQYAHAAVVVVLSPRGRVSGYLYGVEFAPRDVRLALDEASQGRFGSTTDRLLLTCFHYDPASHRYGVYVMGVLRLGGIIVIVLVGSMLLLLWRLDRHARARRAAERP